jgi:hypothetical protein
MVAFTPDDYTLLLFLVVSIFGLAT